jgi:hypothetical protein
LDVYPDKFGRQKNQHLIGTINPTNDGCKPVWRFKPLAGFLLPIFWPVQCGSINSIIPSGAVCFSQIEFGN